MPLEFPFMEVDDVSIAWGGIPNYDAALQACPEEFYRDNPFSRLADKWFTTGQLDPDTDLVGYELTATSVEDAIAQRRYTETWLHSYQPAQEEKMAIGGWLLSLMLSTPEQSEADAPKP